MSPEVKNAKLANRLRNMNVDPNPHIGKRMRLEQVLSGMLLEKPICKMAKNGDLIICHDYRLDETSCALEIIGLYHTRITALGNSSEGNRFQQTFT